MDEASLSTAANGANNVLDLLSPSPSNNASTSMVVAATTTSEQIHRFPKVGSRKTTQHYQHHSTSIMKDTSVKLRLVNIAEERLQIKKKAPKMER